MKRGKQSVLMVCQKYFCEGRIIRHLVGGWKGAWIGLGGIGLSLVGEKGKIGSAGP